MNFDGLPREQKRESANAEWPEWNSLSRLPSTLSGAVDCRGFCALMQNRFLDSPKLAFLPDDGQTFSAKVCGQPSLFLILDFFQFQFLFHFLFHFCWLQGHGQGSRRRTQFRRAALLVPAVLPDECHAIKEKNSVRHFVLVLAILFKQI